ncbi:MAG: VOC family protein [Marinobacterium sp.]|nr:VOC family protein [Marinobacterium sp.]
MIEQNKINYVEFPATDLVATKAFFSTVFGWSFIDYGSEYSCFSDQGVDGGFYKSDKTTNTENGVALVVMYTEYLEDTEKAVVAAGGTIVRPIFDFPGGRRFHFTCPSGNEYGVWSDQAPA